jgi:hypothetical protein
MTWLGWLLVVVALIAVFVVWDLVFCGGEYCRRMRERGGVPPPGGPLPRP